VDIEYLNQCAAVIRGDVLKMTTAAGSGHPGGSLSSADMITALFFGDVLSYDAKNPKWADRDRFVLSKGHVAPVLYSAMARAGYFDPDELATLRQYGSRLQGHPDMLKLPGIEVSTGSLGQGLSIAAGLAYALKGSQRFEGDPIMVYTLLGDGECQEGQVWEAAMFAAHQRLGNLVAIVDSNGLQIDGRVEDVCNPGDLANKFRAFNWTVFEVDGHDIKAMIETFIAIRNSERTAPNAVIATTIKGKGVSFMEGLAAWHGKSANAEQLAEALKELEPLMGDLIDQPRFAKQS